MGVGCIQVGGRGVEGGVGGVCGDWERVPNATPSLPDWFCTKESRKPDTGSSLKGDPKR